jgi:hypothetical protein
MNIDAVLSKLNERQVAYLLIGGVNFMLRHQPINTGDIDVWIEDNAENRQRCELAVAELGAEWGRTDSEWGPVASLPPGWLAAQGMFCLMTPAAPLDIFRSVPGLGSWQDCRSRGIRGTTEVGTPFFGISDSDMLECQLALTPGLQKLDRIRYLRNITGSTDE